MVDDIILKPPAILSNILANKTGDMECLWDPVYFEKVFSWGNVMLCTVNSGVKFIKSFRKIQNEAWGQILQ